MLGKIWLHHPENVPYENMTKFSTMNTEQKENVRSRIIFSSELGEKTFENIVESFRVGTRALHKCQAMDMLE